MTQPVTLASPGTVQAAFIPSIPDFMVSHPQISDSITKLRQLTEFSIQANWHICLEDLPLEQALDSGCWQHWLATPLNAKQQVAWTGKQQVCWLAQVVMVPSALQGYSLAGMVLRLTLTWWAEDAQIFVGGKLVQQGDLFDHSARVLLSHQARAGEAIAVAIRLVSPKHDDGVLVRSLCTYETADQGTACPEPGFVADELAVLQTYLEVLAPERLTDLVEAIAQVDWSLVGDHSAFNQSLQQLRQQLLPLGELVKERQIFLLGHAHLDLAWLWPVSDTWEAAERTFTSVLRLQQEFPDLTFCHSTPALYAWIEAYRPQLFVAIQQQVQAGRWEGVGGLWVEPELNLIAGESLVRQVLYGQQYWQEKFGQRSAIAWLPDSFGFCWQLPQILRQGGIDYFVTQKLRWNDTTEFPHGLFYWEAPDGTQILSLMSAPIGEGIDPLKMASYACTWEQQTGIGEALWLPGVGDHGGGPTRDMLEMAQRWQTSPFFPRMEFTTAQQYLQRLNPGESGLTASLPIWRDELYLEFHRGCYTTHGDQKRWNRRCEGLLYQAELFASLATLTTKAAYPQTELESAWKGVLFNQFHDILPGSAIPEVFEDANQTWVEVEQIGQRILQESLGAIAAHMTLPASPLPGARPLVVFNPLNWQRSELVTVSLPDSGGSPWHIRDLAGQEVPCQAVTLEGLPQEAIAFLVTALPSIGYRLFWLCPGPAIPTSPTPNPKDWVLDNGLLQVEVDPLTGDLLSVFDQVQQREVLAGAGNQLQAFQDQGQYWDAWNINPQYAQHPLPGPHLKSLQWLDQGPLRTRLRVVRELGQSTFWQDYVLEQGSSVLKIETRVDWQETQVLVKAAFSLNLEANYATYEIPCGAIQRPLQSEEPRQQAKWEVPALRWADLSAGGYGVSLLNDSKYGYDSQPDQIRLTLLRSSNWPNPQADRGLHQFSYALYPHTGSWQAAHTERRGYELNLPLQVFRGEQIGAAAPTLQPQGSWLDLQAENLVLMALKRSEAAPHQWILRCYEATGQSAELRLQGDLGLAIAQVIDLLEQPLAPTPPPTISPWKIVSFQLTSGMDQGEAVST